MLARFYKNFFLVLIVMLSLCSNTSFAVYYPPLQVQNPGEPLDLSNIKFSAIEEFNAGLKQSDGGWKHNDDYGFIREHSSNFIATLAGVIGMVLSGLLRSENLLILIALISLSVGRRHEKCLLVSLFAGISAVYIYNEPLIMAAVAQNALILSLFYFARKILLKKGFIKFGWVSVTLLMCTYIVYHMNGDLSNALPWILAFKLLNASILFVIMLKIMKIVGVNKSVNEGVKSIRDATLSTVMSIFGLCYLAVIISARTFRFTIRATIFILYPILKVGFEYLKKVYQWFLRNQPNTVKNKI